jgi:hypothetical protein
LGPTVSRIVARFCRNALARISIQARRRVFLACFDVDIMTVDDDDEVCTLVVLAEVDGGRVRWKLFVLDCLHKSTSDICVVCSACVQVGRSWEACAWRGCACTLVKRKIVRGASQPCAVEGRHVLVQTPFFLATIFACAHWLDIGHSCREAHTHTHTMHGVAVRCGAPNPHSSHT